ncbi:TRAP transporter small permease subunit [Desulfosediminicola flagellatus]|uniref:TRAP transporter small permease subunit n=1 Tax=Desulfosediminicola flagellatus TaxID=2569541 RepID=UPI0010AC85B9|nr:TRAP transporter small permease [Desulfosediminicola flagellatus]
MFLAILRGFCKKVDFIVKMMGYAASYLMPILALIVAFEVFSRYFLNKPTVWAFDLSLFLFGYIAALGGAYAHQKRAHIAVDILYVRVSPKTKRIFNLISYTLGIFFLILIIYVCHEKFIDALKFGTRRQSEWAPFMHHFWIMTIIGSVLFIAQLFRDIIVDVFYVITGNNLIKKGER